MSPPAAAPPSPPTIVFVPTSAQPAVIVTTSATPTALIVRVMAPPSAFSRGSDSMRWPYLGSEPLPEIHQRKRGPPGAFRGAARGHADVDDEQQSTAHPPCGGAMALRTAR